MGNDPEDMNNCRFLTHSIAYFLSSFLFPSQLYSCSAVCNSLQCKWRNMWRKCRMTYSHGVICSNGTDLPTTDTATALSKRRNWCKCSATTLQRRTWWPKPQRISVTFTYHWAENCHVLCVSLSLQLQTACAAASSEWTAEQHNVVIYNVSSFITKNHCKWCTANWSSHVLCIRTAACSKSKNDTHAYDFQLMVLSAINDHGTSFPVAFCCSNRVDQHTIAIFLQVCRTALSTSTPVATLKRKIIADVGAKRDTLVQRWLSE